MAADQGIIDSVSNSNTKTVAEAAAHSMGLAMQNQVGHQHRLNVIAEAAVGNIVKRLTEVDITEALSVVKTASGNDLAQILSSLLASLSSNQQASKTATTTPPVTG